MTRFHRPLALSMLLMIAPLSGYAATVPEHCRASDHTWVPAKYYLRESIVFYEDQWYQARQTHEGREPGSGEFAWQALQDTPTCANSSQATTSASKEPSSDVAEPATTASREIKASKPSSGQPNCPRPEDWSFAAVYTIGDYAIHEGLTYKAIRPTNGTLPGTGHPPQWQTAENACTPKN